jgi:hypothetical protein
MGLDYGQSGRCETLSSKPNTTTKKAWKKALCIYYSDSIIINLYNKLI